MTTTAMTRRRPLRVEALPIPRSHNTTKSAEKPRHSCRGGCLGVHGPGVGPVRTKLLPAAMWLYRPRKQEVQATISSGAPGSVQ